jgi:hypothetical protein
VENIMGIAIKRALLYLFKIELKRILPRPAIRFLKSKDKEDLVGCELGAYNGHNAKSILKELKMKKLYLVDPWDDAEGYDAKGYTDTNPFGDMQKAEKKVRKLKRQMDEMNSEKLFRAPEIEIIKATSAEAAKLIPKGLDFVYVDGAHDYESVKKDIQLYWPKIKRGGLLCGHDFYNLNCSEHDGVIRAVTEFAVKNKFKLIISHPDWLIVNHSRMEEDKKLVLQSINESNLNDAFGVCSSLVRYAQRKEKLK